MDPLEKSNIVKNLFHPTYTDDDTSSRSTTTSINSSNTRARARPRPHSSTTTLRESSATTTTTKTTNEDENTNENTSTSISTSMNMNISTNANIGADDSFFQYPTTDPDHAAALKLHDDDSDDDDGEEEPAQEQPPPPQEPSMEEMEEALHSSMAVNTGRIHLDDDLPPRTLPRNTTTTTTTMPMPIPTPTPMKMKMNMNMQHQYLSKEEEAHDLEARGLITPRKDLQSPPFVKRKMASEMEHDLNVSIRGHGHRHGHGHGDEGNGIGIGIGISSPPVRNFERGIPYHLNNDDGNINIHNDGDGHDINTARGKDHQNESYDNNDNHVDDDDDETNSLVSEYGSEVGLAKFRMEDIQAMEALTEGECECEGEEEGEDDKKERQDCSSSSNPAGAGDGVGIGTGGLNVNIPVETNDSGISYESLKDFSERVRLHGSDSGCDSNVDINGRASTCSTSTASNDNGNDNDDRTRNGLNRRYRGNEDDMSQEDDGSVDSVDLSSHYGPISTEGVGQDHNAGPGTSTGTGTRTKHESSQKMATNIPISASSAATKTNTTATTTASTHSNAVRYRGGRDVPASPMVVKHQHKEENEPTTPIGAVSAALRRFGNGVSNMTRCTKTPPQSSPRHYTFEDAPFQQHKHAQQQQGATGQGLGHGEEQKVWLSPRFGNSKNPVSKTSIQQPMFRSAPQNRHYRSGSGAGARANANIHTSNGITSCLSFDPESGRRPYGNMRISDSPPSSPLPSHRKTRSWGSSGSDFFMGNAKDLFAGGGTGTTSVSGGGGIAIGPGHGGMGAGTGARHGQPYHGGNSSPKREGMVNMSPGPKARIRFVEDHVHSPKPSGNNRAIMLLQSPQVSAFDQTLVRILRSGYKFVLIFVHAPMYSYSTIYCFVNWIITESW